FRGELSLLSAVLMVFGLSVGVRDLRRQRLRVTQAGLTCERRWLGICYQRIQLPWTELRAARAEPAALPMRVVLVGADGAEHVLAMSAHHSADVTWLAQVLQSRAIARGRDADVIEADDRAVLDDLLGDVRRRR